MTTQQETLKKVVWAVFTGLFDVDGWEDLYKAGKEFLWYVFVFVVRVLMLVLFPISIPLLFFITMKVEKDKEKAKVGMREHYRKLHKH